MVEKKEGQLPEERKRVTEKCRSIVETNRETGLTETEAAKRLAADGANELEQEKKKKSGRGIFGAIERSTDLCSAGRGVRVFFTA